MLGFDVVKEPAKVRQSVSVMPQDGRPFGMLTPWDHVYFTLIAKGATVSVAKEATSKIFNDTELRPFKDTQCNKLSGGFKQKVLLSMCLSYQAELYLLDEPTVGLDPISREQTWSLIRGLTRAGKTVILTTHHMDEAEKLSDELAILAGGKLVTQGTKAEIMSVVKERVKVEVLGIDMRELSRYGKAIQVADSVRIFTDEQNVKELVNLAASKGATATVSPVSLEDAFLLRLKAG